MFAYLGLLTSNDLLLPQNNRVVVLMNKHLHHEVHASSTFEIPMLTKLSDFDISNDI